MFLNFRPLRARRVTSRFSPSLSYSIDPDINTSDSFLKSNTKSGFHLNILATFFDRRGY
ncbi:MAG: hypothetical protein ACI875_002405 [Planctomycetota bacterium]